VRWGPIEGMVSSKLTSQSITLHFTWRFEMDRKDSTVYDSGEVAADERARAGYSTSCR